MQIIYRSKPFLYDDAVLMSVLGISQRNNERIGITGSLICRDDLYLQLLEGPEVALMETLERIKQDDRHVDIEIKYQARMKTRLFPQWSMRHDPARSWMWSKEEVARGVMDELPPESFYAVFERLATEAPQHLPQAHR